MKRQLSKLLALTMTLSMTLSVLVTGASAASTGNVSTAQPTARADDVTVVGGGQGIQFKLFNYAGSAKDKTNHINNNGLWGYFDFRGACNDNECTSANGVDTWTWGYQDKAWDGDGYTSTRANVLPKLDANGYPVLDLSRTRTNTDTTDNKADTSLGYLFGASGAKGVTAYDATNTLLKFENGKYSYDSQRNAVDYNTSTNTFYVRNYTERGSSTAGTGQNCYDFMPFTYRVESPTTKYVTLEDKTTRAYDFDSPTEMDYWFGMTMEMEFWMPENGKIDGKDMVFDFSGDDDVWVFIDDTLVMDLGGTHGVATGSINFATGEVKQYLDWKGADEDDSATSNPTTLAARANVADSGFAVDTNANGVVTLEDNTEHTLKFFYLERGEGTANCKISFNMPVLPAGAVTVTKKLDAQSSDPDADTTEYTFALIEKNPDGSTTPVSGKAYTLPLSGTGAGGTTDTNGQFKLKADEMAAFGFTSDDVGTYFVQEVLGKNTYSAANVTNNGVIVAGPVSADFEIHPQQQENTSIVFTNILKGELTVKKELEGNAAKRTDKFPFQVTLTDTGISGTFSGMTFTNGVSELFYLKGGESVTITGLPQGVGYTVKETDSGEYLSTVSEGSQTGVIGPETSSVTIKNYKHNPVDDQLLLYGAKKLENGELKDGQFKFVLEENGVTIQIVENKEGTIIFKRITYSTNKGTHSTYYSMDKVVDVGTHEYYKLEDVVTHGYYTYQGVADVSTHTYYIYEQVPDVKLPNIIYDGTAYRVKVDVTTDKYGDAKTSNHSYYKFASVADAYAGTDGTEVDANGIIFHNIQTYSLTVKKALAGNDTSASDVFSIKVDLKNADIDGEYGEMTFVDGVATIALSGGESKVASGLPYNTSYEVTELNSGDYTVSYDNCVGTLNVDQEATVTNTKNDNSGGGGGGGSTTVNVSVKKVWVLDDGAEQPDSVSVALYRNGKVHKTATLNEANGWSHTWEDLSDSYDWSVDEMEVPEGFTKSVSSSGNRYTITNDDEGDDTPPPPPPPGGGGGDDGDDGTDLGDNDVPRDEMNLEDPDVPKTGDVNLLMWLALAILSGFGLLALLRKREGE